MMAKLTITNELVFRLLSVAFFASIPCAMASAQSAQVPNEETREFEILVSGKHAGTSTTRITDVGNGSTRVITDAAVSLSYVVYTYRYEFHGREEWQGSHLVSVEDWAVDGGKRITASARVDAQSSVIQSKDKRPTAGPVLSMTTSYWHAPERRKGSAINLFDADQGIVHAVRIDNITAEPLAVGGKQVECAHYHLSGDLEADLWFDSHQRLVRQLTTEEGRPVELRLLSLKTARE
jgi:hypothetical protein